MIDFLSRYYFPISLFVVLVWAIWWHFAVAARANARRKRLNIWREMEDAQTRQSQTNRKAARL